MKFFQRGTPLLLLLLCTLVTSEVVFGFLDGYEITNWKYVGKFCYDAPSDPNSLSSFTYDVVVGNNNTILLLYDDQPSSFPAAMQEQTCLSKVYGVDNTGPPYRIAVPLMQSVQNVNTIDISEHIVPRWWYAVFATVDCTGNLAEMEYELTFLQPDGSQVGVQAQGMLGLYIFFFIVYMPWSMLLMYFYYKSKKTHLLSAMTMWAVLFQAVSVMLCMIHFAVYNGNGVGVPFFFGLGQWLNECCVVILLLLVLLVGSGYTNRWWEERKLFLGIVAVYALTDIILLLWYYASFTSSWLTVFMYDSAAGIILMLLRLLVGGFYAFVMRTTHMMETKHERRTFYVQFSVVAGMWLLVEPFLIFVGDAVASYDQEKMQLASLVIFTSVFLGSLSYLFRPNAIKELYASSQRDNTAPLLAPSSLYVQETPGGYIPPPAALVDDDPLDPLAEQQYSRSPSIERSASVGSSSGARGGGEQSMRSPSMERSASGGHGGGGGVGGAQGSTRGSNAAEEDMF